MSKVDSFDINFFDWLLFYHILMCQHFDSRVNFNVNNIFVTDFDSITEYLFEISTISTEI